MNASMRTGLFWLLLIALTACTKSKPVPVRVIFDTDIGPDYDDVGALAMLHHFEDRGEATLLATISCNAFETTAPTLSVINTFFGQPSLPVGIVKDTFPDKDCSQQWAQYIVAKYPHPVKSNRDAEDAVTLYRRILSQQPDTSVTIISVGFFTNLSHLLNSAADTISDLSGLDLVKQKVKHLVSMAATAGDDGSGGYEFNVMIDAKASQDVFEHWPTPVTLSGYGIGDKIHTGIRLINDSSIVNSPVKDAFRVALNADHNTIGRNSWDETAVLCGVRGPSPYFGTTGINFRIDDDGKSVVVPGNKFTWLTFKESPEEIGHTIDSLIIGH